MSNSSTDQVGSVTTVFDNYAEKQLLAALISLIFIVGVIGKSSVLLAVLLSRKPRSTTNVFVVNMAVADLITSCVSLPISILGMLSESREKLLISSNLCALQGFVVVVGVGCSLNNIATIAFFRALITRRKRPTWLFNRRSLAAIVTATWLLPFVVGLLPIVSEFGSYQYDDKMSTCGFNPTAEGSDTFAKILWTSMYPVQLIVTFTCYAVVFCTVRQHVRRINAVLVQPLAVVGGPMKHPGPLQPAQPRLKLRRNIDISLTLYLVVFVFVTCVSPYSLLILLLNDKSQKVLPFFAVLIISNSCINPIIYTVRHRDLKTVIRCILLCRLSKIPMKSAFLQRLLNFRGE